MNMSIKSVDRKTRTAQRPEPGLRPVLLRPRRRMADEWHKGDLLAVPLCILWGVAFWLSMYGPWAIFGLGHNSGAGSWLSSLWNLPFTVARFLMGG
jgi:hypothetical protein